MKTVKTDELSGTVHPTACQMADALDFLKSQKSKRRQQKQNVLLDTTTIVITSSENEL